MFKVQLTVIAPQLARMQYKNAMANLLSEGVEKSLEKSVDNGFDMCYSPPSLMDKGRPGWPSGKAIERPKLFSQKHDKAVDKTAGAC